MSGFDPTIHPPARLQIMAMLVEVSQVEFAVLRDTTGVSDSVLSKHLSALVEAGYVRLNKAPLNGRAHTWASVTRAGRRALGGHVDELKRLANLIDRAPAK